jgi:hypothetical protein
MVFFIILLCRAASDDYSCKGYNFFFLYPIWREIAIDCCIAALSAAENLFLRFFFRVTRRDWPDGKIPAKIQLSPLYIHFIFIDNHFTKCPLFIAAAHPP